MQEKDFDYNIIIVQIRRHVFATAFAYTIKCSYRGLLSIYRGSTIKHLPRYSAIL